MDKHPAELFVLKEWLEAEHACAVATVVTTWGSAPRPPGAQMVIRADGAFEGSVSGGCIEAEILVRAQDVLTSGRHQLLSFGIQDEHAWAFGLACGGQIEVLLQPATSQGFPPQVLTQILAATAAGQSIAIRTDLSTGLSAVLDHVHRTERRDGHAIVLYEPGLRLAIIGAVHVSQTLAPMALRMGYAVCVIDPRTRFAMAERFEGIPLRSDWPDDALAQWGITPRTAVVTLSHDPKLDDVALAVALRSPAFYIASLGSKKTHAARIERLRAQGFSSEACARIHGPAGLPIGAKTPAEIALSILAQMVGVLRA